MSTAHEHDDQVAGEATDGPTQGRAELPKRPARQRRTSEPKRKTRGYALILGGMILIGALLIVQSSFSSGRYSMTIAEINEDKPRFLGRDIKVVGKIKEGSSETKTADGKMEIRFVVHDAQGNELSVVYPHNPPDPYKEGRDCIIEGKLQKDGTFLAHKLTVKCPSKYQSEGGSAIPGGEHPEGVPQGGGGAAY